MSAASWWELAIKKVLGRLQIDFGATREALEKRGVVPIAVTLQHAEVAAALNKLHGDPFDHMLVAQAIAEDLMLLTRDARLKAYGTNIICA